MEYILNKKVTLSTVELVEKCPGFEPPAKSSFKRFLNINLLVLILFDCS